MSEMRIVPRDLTPEMAEEFYQVRDADADTCWEAVLAAAPSPWMPIETAPKDATRVDLWREGERLPNCYFDHGGWQYNQGYPVRYIRLMSPPSHWMPRPPPPTATSAREASPAIDVAQTHQTPASEARNWPSGDCNAEGMNGNG